MNFNDEQTGYRLALELSALVDGHCPSFRAASLPEIVARLSPARHSPDFRSVRWFGTVYAFSPAQASIVSVLWSAWSNGTAKVGAGPLLDAADLLSDKVSDLFKKSEAWGAMIASDGRGAYWLQEPVTEGQGDKRAA